MSPLSFLAEPKTLIGSFFSLLAQVFDPYKSNLVSPRILDASKQLCSTFFPAICHPGISWPQNRRSDFTLIKLQSTEVRALVSRDCYLDWRGTPQWALGTRFLQVSFLVSVNRVWISPGQDLKEQTEQLRAGWLCFARNVEQTLLAAQL